MEYEIKENKLDLILGVLVIAVCATASFKMESSAIGTVIMSFFIAFTFLYRRIRTSGGIDIGIAITLLGIVFFLHKAAFVKSPGAFTAITLAAAFFAGYIAQMLPDEKLNIVGKFLAFSFVYMGFLWLVHTTVQAYTGQDFIGLCIIGAWALNTTFSSPELIKRLSLVGSKS